ncbi:MAG: FAD-dependent oxidoreductase [Verrucomicrobia bacterium]|nr:FAD-dependent oxidoreductase [Verrucomicrobiota bacterium]
MKLSANGEPLRIGFYICHCGTNIAGMVDVADVAKYAESLPGVAVSRHYKYMCSDPGQELIQRDIKEQNLNRIVVASCSPLLHEHTFRKATEKGGLNPFFFHMVNVREHDSWVHTDRDAATRKAKALVHAAIRRVAHHQALEVKKVPIHADVLILGGGIAGIHAALTLANAGKKVYLVEREPSIGGHMAKFDKTFPTLDCTACILTPKMTQVRAHPNIELLSYSEVEAVEGYVGNFKARVRRKTRYVHEDLCTGCAECVSVCPVTLPSEFDEGLGRRNAIYRSFAQAVPNVFTISRRGQPPCQAACSIHQNAQGYVTLIAQGKFKEALDVILRDNPLPAICGRICTHPCTVHCTRGELDDPLNIPGLKRFVTDLFPDYALPTPAVERPERVAIVGSGPAGLMCAYELRQRGYKPVIFEAQSVPGGMLSVGIPGFRLPRPIIRDEIERFKEIGIEIRTNTPVGQAVTLEQLRQQHAAVFIAIGAHQERKLRIPGEDLPNVWGGIEFLRKVNLEGPVPLGKRVLVIGGGNSALDAARTALRCGSEEVTIVYRRTRAEMPSDPKEVEETEHEGVKLLFLAAPEAVVGDRANGITGLQCQRMRLGPPDASGRPAPIPIPNSEFVLPCDALIYTIGQVPDVAALGERLGLDTTRGGLFKADALTLETNLPGVFVGGDCVTGPDVVVNALYAGKKAGISIDRHLNQQDLRVGRAAEGPYHATYAVDTSGVLMRKQVAMPALGVARRRSFDEVHTGYTEEQARTEAQRCLDCAICCDCRLCATVCERKAIDYAMTDQVRELQVGTAIIATGFQIFDARRIPYYGYGIYPNVYTALEVERLVNASGPTGGEIMLRDGKAPQTVGIIHCVGSRDENTNRYCSRVCCLYSLKLAHLIKEHSGAEVYNFYIDMRTPGKTMEEFYNRIAEEGMHLVRGKVADVFPESANGANGRLILQAEDTLLGRIRKIPVDMVVLAVGLEPRADAQDVRRKFNISCASEGFFLERHPKLAPVNTFTDGIFLAGCCQGPKDIPDTVAQAGAAAAEALALIDKGHVEQEPNTAFIVEEHCSGCKSCIPLCPYTAITFDETKLKAVINEALCKGCGTCVASCPSGSIRQNLFEDAAIFSEIEGVLAY